MATPQFFPTPDDATAALAEAEASRTLLAGTLALPSFFYGSIGAAVAAQIATWLVALCAIAGGAAYALSGRRWWRTYQGDPVSHGRGESAAWIAVFGVPAVAGLVLLLIGR